MYYASNEMIFPRQDPINVMSDGEYFDVTHSFKVGSSTYHVLGLRKHRPTYGNTYYIFNCAYDGICSGRASSALPTIVQQTKDDQKVQKNTKTAFVKKSTTTSLTNDPKMIKAAIEEVMKSEHKTLISSIREEIHAEKNTLLQSIEKETRNISSKATNASKNERQEVLRSLKEQITHLESTYEAHLRNLVDSIETLERKLRTIIDTHQEKASGIDGFQTKFLELFERKITDVTNEHLQNYRSTLIDKKAIEELRSFLMSSRERDTTTFEELNSRNSESIRLLFTEQNKYLTTFLSQSSKRSTSDADVFAQLENMFKTTMSNFRDILIENSSKEVLAVLFDEQRKYLRDLLIRERESFFSSETFLQSIRQVFQETQQSTTMIISDTRVATPTFPTTTSFDHRAFKMSIETAEHAQVFAKLFVDGVECRDELHTLCQRDPFNSDIVNCFVIPPAGDEPFELTLYAKTARESEYRAAIRIQMPFANIEQSVTFPHLYSAFKNHQCILVAPLRHTLRENEEVTLHLVLPGASAVSIRNGADRVKLNHDEFHNGVLRKQIRVRGQVTISGQWNGDEVAQDICDFAMT